VKASTLATLLSAVAIGGVGLLYLKLGRLEDDLQSLNRAPVRSSRAPASLDEASESPWLARPRGDRTAREEAAGERDQGAPVHAGRARKDLTLEERVALLERRREEARRAPAPVPAAPWLPGRKRVFARSMRDLTRSLHLTPTQTVRVKSAVERGRERIEAILKIPDETGKSPYERRQERRKKLQEALKSGKAGTIFSFASSMGADRAKKIPGRNETYGQESDRIKKETREEIEGSLDNAQKKSFEQTNIDSLVGAPSEGVAISLFTGAAAKAPEEGAAGQGER